MNYLPDNENFEPLKPFAEDLGTYTSARSMLEDIPRSIQICSGMDEPFDSYEFPERGITFPNEDSTFSLKEFIEAVKSSRYIKCNATIGWCSEELMTGYEAYEAFKLFKYKIEE